MGETSRSKALKTAAPASASGLLPASAGTEGLPGAHSPQDMPVFDWDLRCQAACVYIWAFYVILCQSALIPKAPEQLRLLALLQHPIGADGPLGAKGRLWGQKIRVHILALVD